MQPESTSFKPGRWVVRGIVLGAFAGLLLGKFALGLIFGFFIGIAVEAGKRTPPAAKHDHPPDAGSKA